MSDTKRITMALLVANEAGMLSQVSRLFSRKGYNIETLAVGATDDPQVSRVTIEVITDDDRAVLLANQLRKLYQVYSVKILTPDNSIRRELIMLKVKAETGEKRGNVIQIANIFRASIIDVSTTTVTIAVIGTEQKTAGISNVLKEFEILEVVRTGIAAIERGTETIHENTKERGEFNYGKNVL